MNNTVLNWNSRFRDALPERGQLCLVRQDNRFKPIFSAIYVGSGRWVDLENRDGIDPCESDYGCGYYEYITDWTPLSNFWNE